LNLNGLLFIEWHFNSNMQTSKQL